MTEPVALADAQHSWSTQQIEALDQMRRWADNPTHQVFRLDGFAGTGKTTLARAIYEHLPGVMCASFTGKAASVMQRKGLYNASTIHKLIYDPIGNHDVADKLKELRDELAQLEAGASAGGAVSPQYSRIAALRRAIRETEDKGNRPRFVLKDAQDAAIRDASLVIIDEHSMVDSRMGEDLLSFGVPVLAIGDPAQLPPVRGTGYFSNMGDPNFLLTEIHRQAAGNPIIALATLVREGRSLPLGEYGEARVVRKISAEDAQAADQMLCGTNQRRRNINARHRQLLGHLDISPLPLAGEKLVCLRNNSEHGLLNGTLWRTTADADWAQGNQYAGLKLEDEAGDRTLDCTCEATIFTEPDEREPMHAHAQFFTYGYCLTVHKSQGSQWDNVLLFHDWPGRDSAQQWLYTGITRAAERLTVVIL